MAKSAKRKASRAPRRQHVPEQKRRRRSIIAFDMLRLDRTLAEPLHQQLYRQIRDELDLAVVDRETSRLPSSRALAVDLGVSRLTVNQAFARLHSEGYLRTERGSGTFIADSLPTAFLHASHSGVGARSEVEHRVAKRAREILDARSGKELDIGAAGPPGASLVPGLPAVDEFPMAVWERLRAKVLAQKGSNLLRYSSSRGELELRKAIATYLTDFRGARCHAGQIVIVSGMQQAMMICAMTLVDPGGAVWMEDPGLHHARRAFSFAGARVIAKRVDAEGIVLQRSKNEAAPRLIYVTPSHQWPLGITMSLRRRRELLKLAGDTHACILEDDYNSEFRFDGPPLPCLQGLDASGCVIYAGTMSKILYPSLRIGYLVAPETLVDHLVRVRSVIDHQSPSIDQATLARFISDGFFLSHLKRMRKLYGERRRFFIEEFERIVGDHLALDVTPAGLHFVAWVRRPEDYALLLAAREETGVSPARMPTFCLEAHLPPALVFGFASWTAAQIRESLGKFATAFERLRRAKRSN